jgi:hypothetical protein
VFGCFGNKCLLITKKEKDMATENECLACGSAGASPRTRLSGKALVNIVGVMAAALFLMYAETWAIEQAPVWTSACVLRPASGANNDTNSDTSSPFRDTAGPVAVLH